MAIVYLAMTVRAARRDTVALGPSLRAIGRVASSGGWLFVRTVALRVAFVGTTVVAAGLGTTALAATQIAMTLLFTLALALDALAIAGQALVGHALGTGEPARVRAITRRLQLVGVVAGTALGAIVALLAPVLPAIFTTDVGIRDALVPVLYVLAASIPLGGFVFVLDGVLIGAGDARYLAAAGLINLVVYVPLLVAVALTAAGATWLFAAFGFGYLGIRAVTLGLRARGDGWMR
jgi:Na+-driven multidrug efflux pump